MTSSYPITLPILRGTFCSESKNRFIAIVDVNGVMTECYVPSSAKLDNFIKLQGKRVMLIPTQTKNARTSYSILAVKSNRHNILLNTTLANKAMLHYLNFNGGKKFGRPYEICAEKVVEGYKADIYVEYTRARRIYEIKSVLSTDVDGSFPNVFSERANRQLEMLASMLPAYEIEYSFVAINPNMRSIHVNPEQKEYHTLFKRCIEKGMVFQGYSCSLIGKRVAITGKLPVILD